MRSFLGKFQIQGTDALKPMSLLSGGQKVRVFHMSPFRESLISEQRLTTLPPQVPCCICSFGIQETTRLGNRRG